MISRIKVAEYLAERLMNDDRNNAIKVVAYWLNENGKKNELPYLIKDTTTYLAQKDNYYFVIITTAKPLENKQQKMISDSIKKKYAIGRIEPVFLVDSNLIGGVKVELPDGVLDASIRGKLNKLIENIV